MVEETKQKTTKKAKEEPKAVTLENKVEETKVETKVEEKKIEVKKPVKKDEAIAHGYSISASKKQSMYICDFIKGKSIDKSIKELQEVLIFKRAIPFKGEVPHRKGDLMSGRYPIEATKIFINILKGLKGNCLVNGMDLDKTVIYFGSASWASRPARKGGVKFKRTNVTLKAKEIKMKEDKK